MADYFETDEIVKGYDRVIFSRILSYAKPYKLLIFFMICALVIATAGELLIPVMEQRIIDGAILSRFLALCPGQEDGGSLSAAAARGLAELSARREAIAIDDMVFIPQNQKTKIPGNIEEELRRAGVIDSNFWYAFLLRDDDPARDLAGSRRDIFIMTETAAAIRSRDLYALPLNEIMRVRGRDSARIASVALVLVLVLILVFAASFTQTWTTNLVAQRVMKDLRLELFRKTLYQSTSFLSRHPVGRIVTRLTGDVETLDEFFSNVLVAFLKDISLMIGVLITLFFLSPRLALAALVTLPPVLIVTAISRVKARDAFRRQRTASSQVNSYLSERLVGMQVVQLFRGEKRSRREFHERNRELLAANLGEMHVFAVFRPLVEQFSTVTTAVILTAGAAMILNLSLSLGVLIAFVNLAGMFYGPVMEIAERYTMLQSAMAGGERVFKLLDTDEPIADSGTVSIEGNVRGNIDFHNVHFSYKAGEEVLKGMDFSVRAGEMAAIVGYTGAGKTTITNVLARLWDIDTGKITIDGVSLPEIPLAELRRSVLPVLQDVFLFSGTVAENISLGLELTEEQIEEAARAVHAHEFISRLSDGYRTVLSEGAANISGGQRQLISFARVIAHNPAVVILDEATSSIDTETERLIQLGMRRVLAGRTSIVIAHRLSTIRDANKILVLSDGRIAEQGRHDELIVQDGLYAQLYRLQYERIEKS
ncbi:MAG: ABC transporter ATP-binding protein/permease [Spirochaetaceae bacterium]|jgi:ATP-binding cassette subfamily B protein|nr:ABC transporter ATP-binding protein/permease [Spirochaetaceae bacterium]